MIPGMNLLNEVRGLIRFETVTLIPFAGRTQNDVLEWVDQWGAPTTIEASVQPVDHRLYQQLGLELNKDYVWCWTSADLKDIERDQSGDKIQWGGREWQARTARDWRQMDGWRKVLCVDIGPISTPPDED